MRTCLLIVFAALVSSAWGGQAVERFRSADHFSFCQGSQEARYGNADALVKVTMQVLFLGQQTFTNASSSAETRFNKAPGTLDFTIKLSDFDPNLPPDTVTMSGADLGADVLRHTTDETLPGPYNVQGTFNGVDVNVTLTNVHVTGTLVSQGSNNVTSPLVNPVLGQFCDVQLDDLDGGSQNALAAVPAHVTGWVVSPIFTVQSMRIDVTGIQHAGQIPAHVVAPDDLKVPLGKLDHGDLASLSDLDTDSLRVCKFFVPNLTIDPVQIKVFAHLFEVPQFLSLYSTSRLTVAGSFQQTLELFDQSTQSYGDGDFRVDPINLSMATHRLDATGDLSRYVGQGGVLEARYKVKQTGFSASYAWCSDVDQLVWVTTP